MPEQVFVAKTLNGITLITGCAHPGIIKIVDKVKEDFPNEKIYLVFGGFHLMEKDKREVKLVAEKLKEMKVGRVGPAHCTGYEAELIFKETYQNDFVTIKAGQTFEI